MSKKYNSHKEYINDTSLSAQEILFHLDKLVRMVCPQVEEKLKWNFPHYDYKGPFCYMAAFKSHCSFGFWKAKIMNDPHLVMNKEKDSGMGDFGKIRSLDDLPEDWIIIEYLNEALELNEKGIKLPTNKSDKKALDIPGYFQVELNKHVEAKKVFENLSRTHKDEYVEWITEAKREATKQKRMQTTIEWLKEGKSRNWKYQ